MQLDVMNMGTIHSARLLKILRNLQHEVLLSQCEDHGSIKPTFLQAALSFWYSAFSTGDIKAPSSLSISMGESLHLS